jgi:transposase
VFCRARHERFRESNALRRGFECVVASCIAAGLIGGEAFSIDASLIKADVDKNKRVPGDQPRLRTHQPTSLRLTLSRLGLAERP